MCHPSLLTAVVSSILLLLSTIPDIDCVKNNGGATLNEPNVDRHAIFTQPLTKGIFHFDVNGFIPLEPMIRIGKVHKEIIKTIQKIGDYQKQVKYLLTLSNTANEDIEKLKEKMQSVITTSENEIEEIDVLDKSNLNADAFVLLVSHAGMMSNLVLYFPEVMTQLLKRNSHFEANLKWTISFAVNNKLTQDKSHLELFNLAQQELGIIPKSEDYKNPYRGPTPEEMSRTVTTTTKKPRKKLPRGPQLSGGGRGEL